MSALEHSINSNGVTGLNGRVATGTSSGNNGSIKSLTLGGVVNNKIGNDMPMRISWTATPDIGTSVDVEYSLDGANTWVRVATVPTGESPAVMWTTPSSGSHDAALIRITSTLGIHRVSRMFRIGSVAAARDPVDGCAITNFPNPLSGTTAIMFLLSVRSFVKIAITDWTGREVGTVAWRNFEAGNHSIPFNASELPNGVYTYTLDTGKTRVTGTMTIVR